MAISTTALADFPTDGEAYGILTMGTVVSDHPSFTDADAVREAEEARRLRAERDAALSPSERLERVHELCRQLAAIRPASSAER